MKILGFNFSKICVEKFPGNPGKVKIVPNIVLDEIKSVKADLIKTKDNLLGVKFSYTLNYDPDYAKLEFSGDILTSAEPKLTKEILKEWKNKKLHEDFKVFLFNIILRKANVKAIELEDELNLPLHVPFPSIMKKDSSLDKKSEN